MRESGAEKIEKHGGQVNQVCKPHKINEGIGFSTCWFNFHKKCGRPVNKDTMERMKSYPQITNMKYKLSKRGKLWYVC